MGDVPVTDTQAMSEVEFYKLHGKYKGMAFNGVGGYVDEDLRELVLSQEFNERDRLLIYLMYSKRDWNSLERSEKIDALREINRELGEFSIEEVLDKFEG